MEGNRQEMSRRADSVGAPSPQGTHVQFGADAASQAAVSWLAAAAVPRPRLRLGRVDTGHGLEVQAEERVFSEALSGQTVFTYHAQLDHLQPDTQYIYEVLNDGAAPVAGMFRTGPAGRSRGFRFTSFGDQAVPMKIGAGLGPWTVNAGYIAPWACWPAPGRPASTKPFHRSTSPALPSIIQRALRGLGTLFQMRRCRLKLTGQAAVWPARPG